MAMEATGGSAPVSGRSKDSAASGPMPGSTPIKVPTTLPTRVYQRFCGVRMTASPPSSPWKAESTVSEPQRAARQRHAEQHAEERVHGQRGEHADAEGVPPRG